MRDAIASAQSWLSCIEALSIPVMSNVGSVHMRGASHREFEFIVGIDASGSGATLKGPAAKPEVYMAYILALSVVKNQIYKKECSGKSFTVKVRVTRIEAGTGQQTSRVFPDNRVELVVFGASKIEEGGLFPDKSNPPQATISPP